MTMRCALVLALAALSPLAAIADVAPEIAKSERGLASWYGAKFHGKRTASGAKFDMHALTAAHPTLPFGTRVLVRNLATGKEVEVRITDRGPHLRQRIIDLSQAAARAIGLGRGVGHVRLTVLGDGPAAVPASSRPTADVVDMPGAAM